jgi:Uma2 family endonuclease
MRHAYLPSLNAEDYLTGELKSDIRHEYVDGEVYAMAGAGETHNLIALNVASRLRGLVRGGPCRVFISDMKLRVAQWNAFYYPDVLVTCDASDTQPYFKESPCLIVEVLSPSTEGIDRREKLLAYRTLVSLREYVLISQDKRQIEVYRHAAGGAWHLETLGQGDPLHLECVGAALTLDEVYEDVPVGSAIADSGRV